MTIWTAAIATDKDYVLGAMFATAECDVYLAVSGCDGDPLHSHCPLAPLA